jgi:hypothetical protein
MYSLVVTRQNLFKRESLRLAPRWWRESVLSSIRVRLWLPQATLVIRHRASSGRASATSK